jgi:hypothetical protein
MERLSLPVLTNLTQGTLRLKMPVAGDADNRRHGMLEITGRLLAGMAPWLEQPNGDPAEGKLHAKLGPLAREALRAAADPMSPDYFRATNEVHHIVDGAFLAHAIVRAPDSLWHQLDPATRQNLIRIFREIRQHKPHFNNWLLFSAMIETALFKMGADYDPMRIDYAIRQHEQWYLGDGTYGDGREFHWDYYNSFVIQPMLIDIVEVMGREQGDWLSFREAILQRAQRYAAVQERLIAPDGSFPAIGRSLAYRFGAFQLLSQIALRRELPVELPPAQVRSALTAVIHRTMDAPGTFTDDGWLKIGLAGHQPGLGEDYISTASTYLCATGLLALGLPPEDPFWSNPAVPWTAQRVWSGEDHALDHALQTAYAKF